jgi:hypothetical protein
VNAAHTRPNQPRVILRKRSPHCLNKRGVILSEQGSERTRGPAERSSVG